MNLAVFAGILLAVPMATARRASLGEKTMQATGEANEPEEAMRGAARPARLVEKIVQSADADEPDEAMRGSARPARLVEKIMRAADEADEPDENTTNGYSNGPTAFSRPTTRYVGSEEYRDEEEENERDEERINPRGKDTPNQPTSK